MKEHIQQKQQTTAQPDRTRNISRDPAEGAHASPAPGGLGDLIAHSPRVAAQRQLMASVNQSPRMLAQRKQNAALTGQAPQSQAASTAGAGHGGLPDGLKAGVESLSGMALDDVKVHYNSSRPAQLNALAYAQGRDIHLAPGQERHLPHEAWHVVQQAQGRVQPTAQLKKGAGSDGAVIQRVVRVSERDDLAGQNSIRLWLLQRLGRAVLHDSGKALAPVLFALLHDPGHVIVVDDDVEGALQLLEYLSHYVYAHPRAGDGADPDMAWRRRLVEEILDASYPLHIVFALMTRDLNTGGLMEALNEDVAAVVSSIRGYQNIRPRGDMTRDQIWQRRRAHVNQLLAARFYRHVSRILAPTPNARVAIASAWTGSGDEVLIDLGSQLRTEPRAGAAQDVTAGGLNPNDYADGSAGDPIPFIFYKRPSQYPVSILPKASSNKPRLDWNKKNNFDLYDGTRVQLGGADIFDPIKSGRALQDNSGHGSKRPVERKIRQSLVLDYQLAGLDIDHVLDLGFGGTDTPDNLWPLNQNVNRRPVNGQWRTLYKLHFKDGDKLFKGAIGSGALYHKHYRIKGFMDGTGPSGVPAESGTPAAGKKT